MWSRASSRSRAKTTARAGLSWPDRYSASQVPPYTTNDSNHYAVVRFLPIFELEVLLRPISLTHLQTLRRVRAGEVHADPDVRQACSAALGFIEQVSRDDLRRERAVAPQAHQPWGPDEEAKLVRLHEEGWDVFTIATKLGRTTRGVRLRLKRYGLEPRTHAA